MDFPVFFLISQQSIPTKPRQILHNSRGRQKTPSAGCQYTIHSSPTKRPGPSKHRTATPTQGHTHTHTVGSARDGPLRAPLSRRVAESAQKAHSSSVRENQGGTLHTNSTSRHHGQASRRVHPSLPPSVPHTSVIMPRECRYVQLLLCPRRSSPELALDYGPGLYYSVSHQVHPATSVYRERPVTRVICATLQSPSRMSDASTSPRHH